MYGPIRGKRKRIGTSGLLLQPRRADHRIDGDPHDPPHLLSWATPRRSPRASKAARGGGPGKHPALPSLADHVQALVRALPLPASALELPSRLALASWPQSTQRKGRVLQWTRPSVVGEIPSADRSSLLGSGQGPGQSAMLHLGYERGDGVSRASVLAHPDSLSLLVDMADHGLPGYRKGCRCEVCRAANTARVAREKRRRKERPVPDHIAHGTLNTYKNYGCRCRACVERNNKASADRLRRLNVPQVRYWTPEEELVLLEAPSLRVAAEQLGRSYAAVQWRRWSLLRGDDVA